MKLTSGILKHAVVAAMIASAALGITSLGTAGASAVTTAHAATTTVTASSTRSTATSAPAVAAAPSNCPAGALCGYTGPNYTGSEGKLFEDNPNLNVPGDVWNNVDSIWNNGNYDNVIVYRGENYSTDGAHYACLYRKSGFPNMQSQLPGLYHHIWSNFWIPTTCT